MQVMSIDLSDESMELAQRWAAENHLPVEGAMILSMVNLIADKAEAGKRIRLAPANDLMMELADSVEKAPPSTPEEAKDLAEAIRYFAQFTTTRETGFSGFGAKAAQE